MNLLFRTISPSLPLIAVPAIAADPGAGTGITGVGPAVFLFAVAGALLLTLLARRSTGHLAGYLARRIGRLRMRHALGRRSADVVHDFLLPGVYGGLAKIDHAMMTAGGILCIRVITVRGVVFGGEEDAQWTHVDGTRRQRFLNPLIQNEGRARALRAVVPDVPVANLVVFTGKVEFTTPPPANVIRLRDLDSFIQKFIFGPSKVEDWDAVWLTLRSAVLDDEASRKDFAAQVGFG